MPICQICRSSHCGRVEFRPTSKFGLRIWPSALRDVASDTVKWIVYLLSSECESGARIECYVFGAIFRHTWTCLFLAGTAPQGSDELNSPHSIRSSPSLLRNIRFIQVSRLRLPVLSCKFLSTVLLLTPGRLLKFDCWLPILQYFVFLCGPGDGAVCFIKNLMMSCRGRPCSTSVSFTMPNFTSSSCCRVKYLLSAATLTFQRCHKSMPSLTTVLRAFQSCCRHKSYSSC